jgi:hypothetical protein
VRIEQVLMSSPSPLLCFRLSQLLAFYLSTVEGLLGAGSQLAGNFKFQAWQYVEFQLCVVFLF